MSSGGITGVITKAEIPTKIFYYVNENGIANKVKIEGILPDSLDSSHENKYYYNNTKNKLYQVIKNGEVYETEEKTAADVLPDPLEGNHVNKYYYTYDGTKEFPIGVSSFSSIWGEVEDSEGNSTTLNLQDAMNALFKMMASQSHVWVGNESNVPGYAKLLVETDKQ